MPNKRVEEKLEVLSDEEKAAIEAGLQSEATGKSYSLDEALHFARKRRNQWMLNQEPSAK